MSMTITDFPDISHRHKSAADAVAHAIRYMESALSVVRYSLRRPSPSYFEMRRDMPYIIHGTAIPGTYILVNRNYKPLGSNKPTGGDHAIYEEFMNLHVRLTPEQIASVASAGHSHGLFGDSNSPWSGRKAANAYLSRLRVLHGVLSAKKVLSPSR